MLKPICHSGSIKVPEYLETDKEKNAGRTPLSSDIQQVRNVVEDVPPFPESRTARGSVSAAYRLSFDEVFCGLSNEERKKVYGRLFGKQVLAHIHSRCQWICPYISRHLLSLNPLLACCRRYSRGER